MSSWRFDRAAACAALLLGLLEMSVITQTAPHPVTCLQTQWVQRRVKLHRELCIFCRPTWATVTWHCKRWACSAHQVKMQKSVLSTASTCLPWPKALFQQSCYRPNHIGGLQTPTSSFTSRYVCKIIVLLSEKQAHDSYFKHFKHIMIFLFSLCLNGFTLCSSFVSPTTNMQYCFRWLLCNDSVLVTHHSKLPVILKKNSEASCQDKMNRK